MQRIERGQRLQRLGEQRERTRVALTLAKRLPAAGKALLDLADLALRGAHHPIDQRQPILLEDAASRDRAALDERMGQLERFVNPASANGQRWLKFLKWDELKAALATDGGPDVRALNATLGQLNRDENGLEMAKFRDMADALRQ